MKTAERLELISLGETGSLLLGFRLIHLIVYDRFSRKLLRRALHRSNPSRLKLQALALCTGLPTTTCRVSA